MTTHDADSHQLAYVKTTNSHPYCNFGDGLSPIIVALITGCPVHHCNFDSFSERISAIGTIGHSLRNGRVHIWGTGLDPRVSQNSSQPFWSGPSSPTEFLIHATRGPLTRIAFEAIGATMTWPAVYGDPAILIRSYLKSLVDTRSQKYANSDKIGLVLHMTELESFSPVSQPSSKRARYHQLDPSRFAIINPLVSPTPEALIDKIAEIASYSYILSTSLHGLIIADCFGAKSAWLSDASGSPGCYENLCYGTKIDHRFRDYHLGLGMLYTPVYPCPLNGCLDYQNIVKFLDSLPLKVQHIDHTALSLLGAFPGKTGAIKQHKKIPELLLSLCL
jgi:pyruvyltransferase